MRNRMTSNAQQANRRALWQCLGATVGLGMLTAIAYFRSDWILFLLFSATMIAAILTAIGAQEVWSDRRPF